MAKLTKEELEVMRNHVEASWPYDANARTLLDHIDSLQAEIDEDRWRYVADGELPERSQEVEWTDDEGDILNGSMVCLNYVESPEGELIRVKLMRAWRPLPKPAPVREELKP